MKSKMEKKIIILIGPPCSGKSTWVKEYQGGHPDAAVTCRDTIRYEVGGGVYTMEHEDKVNEIEDKECNEALSAGKTLIVDGTNLNPKYLTKWYDLAEKYGYEIENKHFYVPYKVAMERSEKRKAEGGLYVNKKIMQSFYKRYYKEEFEKEITDYRIFNTAEFLTGREFCVISDLDGTLAMHTGRTPFEWDRINEDRIDERLRTILLSMQRSGVKVIFITGRPESAIEATKTWLDEHFGNDYILFMRKEGDFSKGDVYKKEIYENHVKQKYDVLCVYEDSNRCVEMWRNEGLLTLQVQNCDY